ncbi:unnamed protein product [Hanseniaspora opuntiae]
MNSSNLPRPNVRTILLLRDKLLYESISFKVILFTAVVLFFNNVFLYPGFLYEYLNPNNIEYVLFEPVNILRCVLRYLSYPLLITCDGTANDLLMTCLLLYHMGKRIEFLYKISMKRIFIPIIHNTADEQPDHRSSTEEDLHSKDEIQLFAIHIIR